MKINTNIPLITDKGKTNKRIALFWDHVSTAWRDIWGVHVHHGFYDKDSHMSPDEAQIRLLEKLSDLVKIQKGDHVLDAGCGMGGSIVFLASRRGAIVDGITLSPVQADIAREYIASNHIDNANVGIGDAVVLNDFKDPGFDVVWSLESCEQFYDKNSFIRQAYRVLKNKGRLMLATWCSSMDEYQGRDARDYLHLCRAFDLPYMPSPDYYRQIIESAGFRDVKFLDWSHYVKQSWDIGIDLVGHRSVFEIIKRAGLRGLLFSKQLRLMRKGYSRGMVRYMVFTAAK